MAVVAFPIMAFAEAHHFGFSGAVFDLDGLKALDQVTLQVGDLSFEVFAWAQEQADDEGLEYADANISVGLAGCFAAGVDFFYLILHRMVDGRKEVVVDQGGINILPGIVDGYGGEPGQLK